MIVEERMIGRGKDDVRLIIEKRLEMIVHVVKRGALLIGTDTGKISA